MIGGIIIFLGRGRKIFGVDGMGGVVVSLGDTV